MCIRDRLFKELSITRTSNLAYHIKLLLEENIIVKKGEIYALSFRGLYFVELINIFEELGLADPESSIKIIRYKGII